MGYILIDSEGKNMPYNIGYIVCDNSHNVLCYRSLAIQEGIASNKALAKALNKRPQRNLSRMETEIQHGSQLHQKVTEKLFCRLLWNDIHQFNVNMMYGFNLSFDLGLIIALTQNDWNYFNPLLEYRDIMTGAATSILTDDNFKVNNETFEQYCIRCNKITDKGNLRFNVETIVNWLLGVTIYQEHLALSDCYLEHHILKAIFQSEKNPLWKMDFNITNYINQNKRN